MEGINLAVNNLNEGLQGNAASSEELEATFEVFQNESKKLEELVSFFKINKN